MKNKFYIFTLIFFLAVLCSCRDLMNDATYLAEQEKVSEIVKAETLTLKPTDVYYLENDTLNCLTGDDAVQLYFTPDGDIAFAEIGYFLPWLFNRDGPIEVKVEHDGPVYKISKGYNDETYLTIDCSTGEVFYSDFDLNFSNPLSVVSNDVLCISTFKRSALVEIKGNNTSLKFNLFDYNIPVHYENGYGFLPIELLSSFPIALWTPKLFYNGKDAFLENDSNFQNLEYSAKIVNKRESYSKTFAEYSYGYLCLFMDLYYGRKEYIWKGTDIKNFDSWFEATGLKEKLLSTDIDTVENALGTLLLQDIGDLHTYYYHMTPFWGLDSDGLIYKNPDIVAGPSESRYEENAIALFSKKISETSSSIYENGGSKYTVNIFIPKRVNDLGKYDTLFFTFNGFALKAYDSSFDKYYGDKWKYSKIGERGTADGLVFLKSTGESAALVKDDSLNTVDDFIAAVKVNTANGYGIFFGGNATDSVILTTVANYIIKNLKDDVDRPIKNVVFDFSFNGGGANDGETFFASWALGKSIVAMANNTSGSKSAIEYKADITFDGVYDENDSISDLKKYCITSLYSFSCGNLFPSQAYFDRGVKLLGQTSGGGTCIVYPFMMPSGTFFSTSSSVQMSTLINGSFVDIDAGVTPDVSISQQEFDKVYNRYTFCEKYLD